ncbi:MAG: HPr family phosphocarrier protein [Parvularculaceae bacterium]
MSKNGDRSMTQKTASCTITVQNKLGLHARASQQFAVVVNSFDADVRVTNGDLTVFGNETMELLTLFAPIGTKLLLEATGPQADEVLEKLVELINHKFGETT